MLLLAKALSLSHALLFVTLEGEQALEWCEERISTTLCCNQKDGKRSKAPTS